MPVWLRSNLKSAFVPGGFILSVAALLITRAWIPLSLTGTNFFYYAVFVAALALSLRFRYWRLVFSACVLLLTHHGLYITTHGGFAGTGMGKIAFEVLAFLVPLDFLLITLLPERTLSRSSLVSIAAVLFFEFTFVAIFSRPDQPQLDLFHRVIIHAYRLRLPQPAFAVAILALAIILTRMVRFHKPTDHGMFWALLAACMGLETGAVGMKGTTYFGVAGLILASSVIENSYSLAYRDELTELNSRRAFNDAVLGLKPPYAIAVVDIDHFKSINDTYGHDTGDQVLRLVASRLAAVSGGGNPFRVGGEEFNIVFAGKTAREAFDHLELLRMNIESCSFRIRQGEDRRKTPREAERRKGSTRKAKPGLTPASGALSVTVSIGIAQSRKGVNADQVIQRADQALYTAKQGGRNRIEVDGEPKVNRRNVKPRGPRLV